MEWTKSDEEQLAELWPNKKSTEIAKIMGRSNMSIRAKAASMKLERSSSFKAAMSKPWTEKQIAILKNNKNTPYKVLSKLIGKPITSIRTKAHALGISRKSDLNKGAHMKKNTRIEFKEPVVSFKGYVSLYDIQPDQCRYSTDTGASMMCCGEKVHEGYSYCTEHCHVVYVRFGEKKSGNVKPISFYKGSDKRVNL